MEIFSVGETSGNSSLAHWYTIAQACLTPRNLCKSWKMEGTIEGLSWSVDNYKEVIECLKARYDQPRLILQAHVLEAAPLKEGPEKSCGNYMIPYNSICVHWNLWDTHGYEPLGPFITPTLKLNKLQCLSVRNIARSTTKTSSIFRIFVLRPLSELSLTDEKHGMIHPTSR